MLHLWHKINYQERYTLRSIKIPSHIGHCLSFECRIAYQKSTCGNVFLKNWIIIPCIVFSYNLMTDFNQNNRVHTKNRIFLCAVFNIKMIGSNVYYISTNADAIREFIKNIRAYIIAAIHALYTFYVKWLVTLQNIWKVDIHIEFRWLV